MVAARFERACHLRQIGERSNRTLTKLRHGADQGECTPARRSARQRRTDPPNSGRRMMLIPGCVLGMTGVYGA